MSVQYVRYPIGDSYYGEWRDRLKLKTTPKQDRACLMLEVLGLKFLVDYGYENAESVLASKSGTKEDK
jgi:hypothetical protein